MLDKESQKVDYNKYLKELWILYALAIKKEEYWLAFKVLCQIRLEVIGMP